MRVANKPKLGQKIVVRFYDHVFESDWTEHDDLLNRRWDDLDNKAKKHLLPVVEYEGYVLEWSRGRIILKIGRSSDDKDMAWFIVPSTVISWRVL